MIRWPYTFPHRYVSMVCALLLCVLTLVGTAQSADPVRAKEYTVIDIGSLPDNENSEQTEARAINNKGEIVGESNRHPFLWSHGKMLDLWSHKKLNDRDLTAWYRSGAAVAINDVGEIVVENRDGSSNPQAFFYDGGKMVDLSDKVTRVISGSYDTVRHDVMPCSAKLLTPTGKVVGNAKRGNESDIVNRYEFSNGAVKIFLPENGNVQTVVGSDGKEHYIGTVANGNELQATAANAKGDIIGKNGSDTFLYSAGKLTFLGIPKANVRNLLPVAISESGKVVVQARVRVPKLRDLETAHSYLYDAGKLTDIGSFGGVYGTLALAINKQGTVVGFGFTGGESSEHAFVYKDGKLKDLNQVATVPPAWVLWEADLINDRGQIVCLGLRKNDLGLLYNRHPVHVFLLTPKGTK